MHHVLNIRNSRSLSRVGLPLIIYLLTLKREWGLRRINATTVGTRGLKWESGVDVGR